MSKKEAEDVIARELTDAGLGGFEREYRFHPDRRWRFDFAWVAERVALEVEGSVWARGRHTRGKGYLGDIEKYSEAALLTWLLVRVSTDSAGTGQAVDYISRALELRDLEYLTSCPNCGIIIERAQEGESSNGVGS